MNKNSKKVRIMAIILAVFLALTFILPAFSMLAGAEGLPEPTPTAEATTEPTPTVEPTTEPTPTVQPTAEPTPSQNPYHRQSDRSHS